MANLALMQLELDSLRVPNGVKNISRSLTCEICCIALMLRRDLNIVHGHTLLWRLGN